MGATCCNQSGMKSADDELQLIRNMKGSNDTMTVAVLPK